MKKLVSVLLAVVSLFSVGACKNLAVETINDGEGVLNILCMEAGYGTSFMTKMIEEFKKDNPDIEVNVVFDVQSTETADKYYTQSTPNPYDLFFTAYMNYRAKVDSNWLESITDVYESFENPIVDIYKEYGKHKNNYYTMPWAYGPYGLVYNTDMLPDDRVPATTDELVALTKDIAAGRVSTVPSGVPPFVWGGKNAAAYWEYLTDIWWAQYEGTEKYQNFWTLNDSSADDGYTVYGQEGIKLGYSVLEELLKIDGNSLTGSQTKDHTVSQSDFMLGKAVMLPCGDWLERETIDNYPDVKNYKLMRTPVLSALGASLKLAGDSADNAAHDAKLSAIVKLIDAGKNDAEIASETQVSESKIKEVRTARSISLTSTHQAFIPASSNAKTEAKAFLKFMSTKKAGEIFKKEAHSMLPFKYKEELEYKGSAYLENNCAIAKDATFIYYDYDTSAVRYIGGLHKWVKHEEPALEFYAKTLTAEQFRKDNFDYFTSNGENKWEQYKRHCKR